MIPALATIIAVYTIVRLIEILSTHGDDKKKGFIAAAAFVGICITAWMLFSIWQAASTYDNETRRLQQQFQQPPN